MTPPGQFLGVLAGLLTTAFAAGAQGIAHGCQESRDWRTEIIRVHSRFRGRPGTFAHFGDSITESHAFWAPLKAARKDAPAQMVDAFRRVESYMRPECWQDWKGPEYGNQGGQTTRWADQNVGDWLERLEPEVALVMFGTNDLRDSGSDEYRARLRSVVRRCLDRGTVVILSTIPPRHGLEKKSAEFADVARQVAQELAVPLVDYHAEILKRRPDDWDGASSDFRMFTDYNVPTLLARDGVHPSAPQQYRDCYSAQALRCHGYGLRNYLVLMKYAEVIGVLAETHRTRSTSGCNSPQFNGS